VGRRVGIENGVDEKGWKGGEGGYHRAMICLCSLNVELRIVAGKSMKIVGAAGERRRKMRLPLFLERFLKISHKCYVNILPNLLNRSNS
jgi:hypothetical protein